MKPVSLKEAEKRKVFFNGLINLLSSVGYPTFSTSFVLEEISDSKR